MKQSEQDSLLNEILGGDEMADLRETSLQAGLRSLHNRRRFGRSLRTSAALLGAILMTLAGVSLFRPARPAVQSLAKSTPIEPSPSAAGNGSVKFINDDELLALFAHRAVALVRDGSDQQRLVFLDAKGRAALPRSPD